MLRRLFIASLSALLLAIVAVSPASAAAATGGASADSAEGGPLDAGALPYGAPTPQRPIARLFRVAPRTIREGSRPTLRLRIDERGVDRVRARVVAISTADHAVAARFSLGAVRTGRTVRLAWPAGHAPQAGSYLVRLHVTDPYGSTLARAAAATGKSRLIVRPRRRPEKSQPEPRPQPTPVAAPTAPADARSGVFPVRGPHTFGGPDAKFGAGRTGHVHEGQDVLAADGTPLVSPLAGTVRFVDFQAGGAGWYVVLDADDGRTLFFAHLRTGSVAVAPGARVAAGQSLGQVGATGDASGPHLHFEIWQDGWRDRGGKPVDPLEQLLAWDR